MRAFHNKIGVLSRTMRDRCALAVLVAVTACTSQPVARPDEGRVSLQTETILPRSRLINEGGVVFAIPGEVRFPGYFAGHPSDLLVRGEGLNGNRLSSFASVPLDDDGRFQMISRPDAGFFVVAVEFNHAQRHQTLRALVKGDANDPVIVDVVSTMLAARVQLAAREHDNVRLDYRETTSLTERARNLFGAELQNFRLDRSTVDLAYQFEALAQPFGMLLSDWREFNNGLLRDRPSLNSATPPPPRAESTPDVSAK